MSILKLGLYKLPAAEVLLIKTLLRLYGGVGNGAKWALADAPPWDAVLVDGAAPGPVDDDWDGHAAAVLRITRIGEAFHPDTIERPIRPDRLLRWLEAQRPAVGPALLAPTTPVASSTEVFADVRYRLRRWPPSSVLRNDARRVRMATLLSKRAFNANELAAVSQQPPADCHALLRLLRGTGLVEAEVEEVVSLPVHKSFMPVNAPLARKPERFFNGGLISGLRRRLGL